MKWAGIELGSLQALLFFWKKMMLHLFSTCIEQMTA